MAETASTDTDKGTGLGVLFGLLGIGGALLMYLGASAHDQVLSGLAFAAAMAAGTLAVLAIHVY